MAQAAKRELEARKIEVNRLKLIETLEANKKTHITAYEQAKAGYRAALLAKIRESFSQAEKSLKRKYDELVRWANDLTDAEIAKVDDHLILVQSVYLEMKVPRCYSDEYDAAIDVAKWDVRENLELTYAEFQCFVRDQWDWKSGFENISAMYTQH